MTKRITLDDICESTNTILRHARVLAANNASHTQDAYVIGYFSGFIETFLHAQPDAVQRAYVVHVKERAPQLEIKE
jgi:hypothetical protein